MPESSFQDRLRTRKARRVQTRICRRRIRKPESHPAAEHGRVAETRPCKSRRHRISAENPRRVHARLLQRRPAPRKAQKRDCIAQDPRRGPTNADSAAIPAETSHGSRRLHPQCEPRSLRESPRHDSLQAEARRRPPPRSGSDIMGGNRTRTRHLRRCGGRRRN